MKKILNIELKETIKFNFNPPMCVYDNIATVANYFNVQYELMFIDVLDFNSAICINSDRIEITEERTDSKFKRLDKHYGLVIRNKNIESFDDFVEVLKSEIIKGKPLMVGIDSYSCHWDPAYKKGHITHICLLSGFDEEEERLYFTDPFHSKKDMSLSIEEFSKAYSKYYTFEIVDREKEDINIIFAEKIDWIRENAENKFINFLSEAKNIVNNIDKYEKESIEKFYHQFKEIILREAYNFTCFANIISYLRQSNSKYAIIFNQYERLFSHMIVLYSLMWKGIVSGNMDKLAKAITDRINTISDLYRKNNADIIKICSSGIIQYIDDKINYRLNMTSKNGNAFIDLGDCFKNKGIGDITNIANLTGFGEYLLKNKDLSGAYLEDGGVKFQMSSMRYDNIMCSTQNIKLEDKAVYNTLNILGCSEFGDNQGKLKIVYENGESDEVFIKFPDFYIWDNVTPDDGTIIWTGKAAVTNSGMIEELAGTAHLYYNSFILKEHRIKNIILPNAPYLHIFAITLSKK